MQDRHYKQLPSLEEATATVRINEVRYADAIALRAELALKAKQADVAVNQAYETAQWARDQAARVKYLADGHCAEQFYRPGSTRRTDCSNKARPGSIFCGVHKSSY
jgi:hypothetical protein